MLSPVSAQNVDSTPDIDNSTDRDNQTDLDNLPDMSNSTWDGPLMPIESNCYQSDTEYLLTDRITSTEQADETGLGHNDSPDDHPDIQAEQLQAPPDISDKDEEQDGIRGAEL